MLKPRETLCSARRNIIRRSVGAPACAWTSTRTPPDCSARVLRKAARARQPDVWPSIRNASRWKPRSQAIWGSTPIRCCSRTAWMRHTPAMRDLYRSGRRGADRGANIFDVRDLCRGGGGESDHRTSGQTSNECRCRTFPDGRVRRRLCLSPRTCSRQHHAAHTLDRRRHPNNPTGTVAVSAAMLLRSGRRCRRPRCWWTKPTSISTGRTVLPLVGRIQNLFVARTFSKALRHGRAARRSAGRAAPNRCAWCAASARLIT